MARGNQTSEFPLGTRFSSREDLAQAMATLSGASQKRILESYGDAPETPEPTFAEIEAEPKDIERTCNCCKKPFYVSLRVAEEMSHDDPFCVCNQCFEYASTDDLTLPEQERFPVKPPEGELLKRIRNAS